MSTEIKKLETSAIKFADTFALQGDALRKFNKTLLSLDLVGIDISNYEPNDFYLLLIQLIEKDVDLLKKDAYIVDLPTKIKTENEKGQKVEKTVIKPSVWYNINYEKQLILSDPSVTKLVTMELPTNVSVVFDFDTLQHKFEYGNEVAKERRYVAIIEQNGVKHSLVMSESEILSRLPENFSDAQKKKYTGNFAVDHCTKMVLRNLRKNMRFSSEIENKLSMDGISYNPEIIDTDFEEVETPKKAVVVEKTETKPKSKGLSLDDIDFA